MEAAAQVVNIVVRFCPQSIFTVSPDVNSLARQDLYWCVQRLPVAVISEMKRLKKSLVVAGGFIRSCITNEPIQDIDLFTTDQASARELAWAIAGRYSTAPIATDNAFTIKGGPIPIQVISRWTFDEPEKVVPSFDFTIARAAFWVSGLDGNGHPVFKSLCDDRYYTDLAAKRLVYCSPERIEEAGGSFLRVLKFYQRGYRIPLDSLGAVIARLMMGVDETRMHEHLGSREEQFAFVLTGLLREVDPAIDPFHMAHMPAVAEETPIVTPE